VNGFNTRNDIETPISALPSRFVSDQLLPSPSSFYADWWSNTSRDNNMLPSPLAFPTPIVGKATGFDDDERKRKLEESSSNTPEKRLKT
jgi:MADS-box transcription factor